MHLCPCVCVRRCSLFVRLSLCVRLCCLACVSVAALGSVFACLVFGGEPVAPPVSPLALAKSVLLACLKVCLFCVGLFAVRFACVQSTPQKPTQQGLSCGCASLWPKRRARRVVELCSRARAALGKRQHDRATYKRTVNTLKEGTESRRVGFGAACFLASLRGGRGSREDLVCQGALCDPTCFCSLLSFSFRAS